jgi:hypothetical protein
MITSHAQLQLAYKELPLISEYYTQQNPIWARNRIAMRNHVANDSIDNLLQWSTVQATMFTVKAYYIDHAYGLLMKDNTNRWMKAIKESDIGLPYRLGKNPKTSGNMVNQAYHLMQYEQLSGLSIEDVGRIVEFGGGYGAMPIICRRLGFAGDYHIYDLPEFSLIQDYYLNQMNMADRVYFHHVDDAGRFPAPPLETDWLIASHSLTEVGKGLRETFIYAVNADYVLIAMGVFWGEDSTPKAVNQMTNKLDKWKWDRTFSETQNKHSYLVGVRA